MYIEITGIYIEITGSVSGCLRVNPGRLRVGLPVKVPVDAVHTEYSTAPGLRVVCKRRSGEIPFTWVLMNLGFKKVYKLQV
jgi:hypothetical protein